MCDRVTIKAKASSGKKPTGNLCGKTVVKCASRCESSSGDSDSILTDKIKLILNHISAEDLNITIQKLKSLMINNERKLKVLVKSIFEKSVNDKQNAELYAKLCERLSAVRVVSVRSENVFFKNLLVEHCRQEVKICFSNEGSDSSQLWYEKVDAIGFWSSGSRVGSPMADAIRLKKMGTVVFAGHLFRAQILSADDMKAVINKLFSLEDEDVWDCLCSLLLIIGRDMEAKKQDLTSCLMKMKEVADKRQLSASAREKLKRVIECKRNKWRELNAVCSEYNRSLKQEAPRLSDSDDQDDAWALGTLAHVAWPRRVLRHQMRQARDRFNEP
ncbi:hypothetical protein Cfor_07331 [Coptotermes formosanus]|uniref:MIF4G domain-containing protein n=1 Tax=Coptotermes formosanus TaxID=36987 RepID=A0A6L2P8B3_COPFO|nr:hypothetical protein Cfor_07331 [Coptotermes formosanus]